jgi:hypothetical protein
MPGIKSLVIRVEMDKALKAHNCQRNSNHRIEGDRRLKVRSGRSWSHYCVSCAVVILERDIAKLQALERQFQAAVR